MPGVYVQTEAAFLSFIISFKVKTFYMLQRQKKPPPTLVQCRESAEGGLCTWLGPVYSLALLLCRYAKWWYSSCVMSNIIILCD